jgi:AcrR family transcriptional regulator
MYNRHIVPVGRAPARALGTLSLRHAARPCILRDRETVVRDTPTRILDAAERCMNRYGLGVSMRDVAVEAGLSRGSLYRYYGERETLVEAVLTRAADRFVARAATRIDRRERDGGGIAGEIAEAIAFVASSARRLGQRQGWEQQHGHGLDDTVAHLPADRETPLAAVLVAHPAWVGERWLAFWRSRFGAAVERGELRADLDVERAAEHVTRLLLSFALVPGAGAARDGADLSRFVDEVIRGFAA